MLINIIILYLKLGKYYPFVGLVSVAALKNRRSSVTLSSTGITMKELIEQY